jgi:hypothetical protein
MAKLTAEERKALEDQLAADDADDDDDDEVQLGFPDGSSFKGTFRRAQEVAAARGFKLKADPPPAPPGDGKDGGNVKRFSGRRVS